MGYLYQGDKNSEHRIYQSSVLAFAGYNILKQQGYFPADRVELEPKDADPTFIKPSTYPPVVRLNEAASTAFALAMIDDLCFNGMSSKHALDYVRSRVVFTNHTKVRAAMPSYPKEWADKYFKKGMRSERAKSFLDEFVARQGGVFDMGSFAIYVAGKLNGVSQDHGKLLSEDREFVNPEDGTQAHFKSITNGIHRRWIDDNILEIYKKYGIVKDYDLPADNVEAKIDAINPYDLYKAKLGARAELLRFLQEDRIDHKGRPIVIPKDRVLVGDARRVAEYKQRDLLLDDVEQLKQILREGNIHLLISGNVHPDDRDMKYRIQRVLQSIESDQELSDRITYIQDYDEEVGKRLTAGCDAWVNTPRLGLEACGTSIFKAIANETIVVSIPDGGMRDMPDGHYIHVTGQDRAEQRQSLYDGLRQVSHLAKRKDAFDEEEQRVREWAEFVKRQHRDYARIISGARMAGNYAEGAVPEDLVESAKKIKTAA